MLKKLQRAFLPIIVTLTLTLFGCATTEETQEPPPEPPPAEEPEPPSLRTVRILPGAPVLDIGDRLQLEAETHPELAEVAALTWQTNDPQVIGVSAAGTVTAVNAGTTTVTLEAADQSGETEVSDRITIVVKDRVPSGDRTLSFAFVPAVSAEGVASPQAGESPASSSSQELQELGIGEPVWMLDTPVPYALWTDVHEWATQDSGDGTRADGGPLYEIASIGRRGNDGAQDKSSRHPVTRVSWRSAVVWANALTEYVNSSTGSSFEPVYYQSDRAEVPLRRATRVETIRRDVLYSQDNPFVKETADGFRLPSAAEWSIAARYIVDADGDGTLSEREERYGAAFASGADAPHDQAAQSDVDGDGFVEATTEVAVFSENANGSTAEVASKRANGLGIYDMSGNVSEWVFDWDPARFGQYRGLRGGSWTSESEEVRIDAASYGRPWFEDGVNGFRVVRSALRIPVSSVDLPDETITIPQGRRRELSARIQPANAYNRKVTWESSNPEVAPVSEEGLVTGQSVGQATITVTAADGGLQDSVIVEVRVAVTGISLNRQSATLFVGESEQLEATISPENAANRQVQWESASPEVVRVSQDGRVTGVSVGTATITATSAEGAYSANFTAVVKESLQIAGRHLNMVSVPPGDFPKGLNDDQRASVGQPFRIAETEITYALWDAVRSWAESAAEDGNDAYVFRTSGRQGGYWPSPVDTNGLHPVTELDWQSAVVWTNALTEYYNGHSDADLRPVYYADQELTRPLRNAHALGTDDNGAGNVYMDTSSNGFRLPSGNEWELAARFKGSDQTGGAFEFPPDGDRWWTPGNYASGAEGSVDDTTATRAVAVVSGVPGSTGEVKSRAANALGLYDMSGNIAEWTLMSEPGEALQPAKRGGSWFDVPAELRVSRVERAATADGIDGFTAGLRVVRSVAIAPNEEAARQGDDSGTDKADSTAQQVEPTVGDLPEVSPSAPEPEPEGDTETGALPTPKPAPVSEDISVSPDESGPPDADEQSQPGAVVTLNEKPVPGTVQAFLLGDTRLELVYAPAGTIPAGLQDAATVTVADPFWLGRREVSFSLWKMVRDWGLEHGYEIPSEGGRHVLLDLGEAPVGRVSWRSAVVWANALTEFVNAHAAAELEPAYYADQQYDEPVRSAQAMEGSGAVFSNEGATGFRLPTTAEWSLAARYAGSTRKEGFLTSKGRTSEDDQRYWLPGTWVSGMQSENDSPTQYAVFNATRPRPVGTTRANALGIFDMSGNVEELCADVFLGNGGNRRFVRGGSFISSRNRVGIGHTLSVAPGDDLYMVTGFRVARSVSADEARE